MFEGYSGSNPSGFRREVEQEHALGQIDDVVEHYEEAIKRGLPPAGPAAARLRNEFARIRDELDDLPGRIEAEIAALRSRWTEELRALRSSNRNMAQHIQTLSLLVRKQEQRIARLQAESSELGRVATFVALAATPRR